MPKISVIIGIYNCATMLQEALDSLYAQTYQDFEIILCDDGSKDNTYDVAFANQQKYPGKIILLRNKKNLGLNQTLNNCLAVAHGKYIARMDGDDLCMPDRLEVELRFLEEHPEYAIVSSPMEYFDENGTYRVGKGRGEVKKEHFIKGTPICHAPCMVRKEAYDAVGGYSVDSKLLRVEDYHLWFKMYAAGYKGYMLNKAYYKMRDDRNAVRRRNWMTRRNEFYVKWIGYPSIGLPWYTRFHSIVPILKYFTPGFVYRWFHYRKK